jgi:rare lipoprotein A
MNIFEMEIAAKSVAFFLVFGLMFSVASCGSWSRTTAWDDQLEGIASYYAEAFHGRKTSNGEVFDMNALTAAHRSLPFNSRVRVTNLDNNRTVEVRINDRGPFKDNRVIDLSLKGAIEIGLVTNGTAPVRIEIIELGPAPAK